jgi:hypothetical protein
MIWQLVRRRIDERRGSEMLRASAFATTLLVAGAFACAAQAAVVTINQGLAFTAASQSFWGPGGSSASFSSSQMFGSHGLGMSYAVSASTGTVSGGYAGTFSGSYLDEIQAGGVWGGRFSFSGLIGKNLNTQIGARIDVTAHALGGDVCVLCYNYSLDGTLATGPALDQQTTDAEVLTFASPGVGVNIGAASVKAGVDLNIQENLKFTPQAVSGVLQATSRSGTVVRQPVYFDADGTEVGVSFKLFERGDWAFDFVDMELVNLFDNDFVLGIDPFVQYTIGFRCGDPGSNNDNGWFCAADDKATFHLAGVNLYNGNPFALDFSGSDLSAFNVRVTPEPSTLALLSLALGIGAVRRRARV